MAFGPVNVPGAAGVDLEGIMNTAKAAQTAAAAAQKAAEEAKAAAKKLEDSIKNGEIAISAKPVFPVVSADVTDPEQGEAWILAAASVSQN